MCNKQLQGKLKRSPFKKHFAYKHYTKIWLPLKYIFLYGNLRVNYAKFALLLLETPITQLLVALMVKEMEAFPIKNKQMC